MSMQISQKSQKLHQQDEKQKKQFMKITLNSLRKYFNNKELPYHPLITCVSVKPGGQNRSASLQSYPNQSVWKSLTELSKEIQEEVVEFLIKELDAKQQKFSPKFLIEGQQRIRNNFDFQSFYKEPTKTDIQQNDNQQDFQKGEDMEIKDEGKKIKQKKWFKGEDFVSESKQIATQMRLCNQFPPLVTIHSVHFQKMRSLLQKIKEQKFKQSEEMKIFVEELVKFISKDPKVVELKQNKKIKKSNNKQDHVHDDQESIYRLQTIQDQVKVEDNSAQDFLDQFKMKVKQIEPGIVMYLPQYQKINPQYHQYYKNEEDKYFKELYYKERVEEIVLNPQSILRLARQVFQNTDFLIPFNQQKHISQK